MTYAEAMNFLKELRTVGIQMGLERMERVCAALSHPEAAYPAVHITGTNGKGSTAAMIAAMLSANGYKVGLYTSPAITDVTDMIRINGQPISKERFAECVNEVADTDAYGLTEYECLTAAVFLCFQKEKIDIAVIECCLGGETDATNVLPPPLCAVFTPIALDHTAILGDTVDQIAACKSGIIKPSCDVVCAHSMSPDALAVIYEKAYVSGSAVYQPRMNGSCEVGTYGTRFLHRDRTVTLKMLGSHQQENACTALAVMERLHKNGFVCNDDISIRALEDTTLPCRQEIVSHDPFIILDGAHNPHGIQALCRTLDTLQLENAALVLGMLADKDIITCLQMLAPYFTRILCCTPANPVRALEAEQLADIAGRHHPQVFVVSDPVDAFEIARRSASAIVVGGSFYTASAARKAILPTTDTQ